MTAASAAGQASAGSAETATVAAAPPAPTAPPSVSGTAEEGQTLSAEPGSWSGTGPIAHAYQWQRCDDTGAACAGIAGATTEDYTLTTADVGFTVRVQITASNAGGEAAQSSDASSIVASRQ